MISEIEIGETVLIDRYDKYAEVALYWCGKKGKVLGRKLMYPWREDLRHRINYTVLCEGKELLLCEKEVKKVIE